MPGAPPEDPRAPFSREARDLRAASLGRSPGAARSGGGRPPIRRRCCSASCTESATTTQSPAASVACAPSPTHRGRSIVRSLRALRRELRARSAASGRLEPSSRMRRTRPRRVLASMRLGAQCCGAGRVRAADSAPHTLPLPFPRDASTSSAWLRMRAEVASSVAHTCAANPEVPKAKGGAPAQQLHLSICRGGEVNQRPRVARKGCSDVGAQGSDHKRSEFVRNAILSAPGTPTRLPRERSR